MSEAARFIVRAELARRFRSYLGVAVVVAISSGVAMASLAGARRTDSAFDRYLDHSDASDLSINVIELDDDTQAVLEALPGVESVRTYAGAVFAPVDPETFEPLFNITNYEAVVSVDGRFLDQDRAALTAGRLPDPDRADEVLINRTLARATGFEVGQQLDLVLLDPTTFEPSSQVNVTVTGIGVTAEEVAVADIDDLQRMIVTPAMLEEHPQLVTLGELSYTYWWSGLRLERGVDPASVEAAWEATGRPSFEGETNFRYRRTDTVRDSVQQANRPQVVALAAFGAVAAALALALASLAVRRTVRAGATDAVVLRAIGADPRTATVGPTVGSAFAVVVGALGAALAAVLVSPLTPIGPVRAVEPNDGFALDLVVLVPGFVLLAITGIATALFVAQRVRSQPDAVEGTGPELRLPGVLGLGVQFALGRRSAAARTAVAGAVLATVAVVATLTFGQSLRHLESTPRLFGADFDVAVQVGAGYGQFDPAAFGPYLDEHHPGATTAWATLSYAVVTIDDVVVPVLGFDRGTGDIGPSLLSGREAAGDDEIVLGHETRAVLAVDEGDTVEVEGTNLTVVGTAVLPALGQATGDHPTLGTGAWLTGSALRGLHDADSDELGASAILLRRAPGTDVAELVAALERDAEAWGLFEEDLEEGAEGLLQVLAPPRPAELVGTSGSGTASVVLSGSLFVGALVALAFALAASVRLHRRELAVLKSIGCTRRQVLGMIETQALVTMFLGALLGIPLGFALGSTLWRRFADDLGVLAEIVVPVRLVVVAGVVGTVVAIALAALPARSAAQAPAALVLRNE